MYFGTRVFILAAGTALMPHFAEAQQEPRVTRHTTISAMRINEAQSLEGDSLQEEAYRGALEAVYDGLSEEDDNPQAYLHLGLIQTELSSYLAADSAFDKAEALYPDYVNEEDGTTTYRFKRMDPSL